MHSLTVIIQSLPLFPSSRENSELSERSIELEVELSRLKEQSVDHRSLLTTMAQDKETLSRWVGQWVGLHRAIMEHTCPSIVRPHPFMIRVWPVT